jgi:hypothetical protein
MLAYHKPVTPQRRFPNGTSAGQPLLHMGLALIEASEHVLATAKSVLRSVPNTGPQMVRVPSFTESLASVSWTDSPDDGEWVWARARGGHLGLRPPCEAVVENDW